MPGAKSPNRPPQHADDPGRTADLGELYRHHSAWLQDRLRRRLGPGSAADVEDLVQETYVRALLVERSRRIDHPRALLLKIAGRLAIDLGRRAERFAPFPAEDAAQRAVAPEQESELLLKQVILKLPPRLRDVFVLSRLAGLSYDQIARELGLSTKTVEARMSKALALCAARLRE